MSSYFESSRFTRCFRSHHTLAQYLVIFGSLVFLFCLYSGGLRHFRSAVLTSSISDAPVQLGTTESVRLIIESTIKGNPESFKSSCSPAADGRGPHQKVIGYSIYGKNLSDPKFYSLYLKSFTATLKEIPAKYPGWVVRIYNELTSDDVESWKVIDKVLDLGANVSRTHIDLCNATQIIKNRKLGDLFEMTWRWLPLLDELVDTFMSRDADSVILPREQAAVAEWLASNSTFHIMRDHPDHCLFFLGGAWGVKISKRRSEIVATAEKMFGGNHVRHKGYDQELLIGHFQSMAAQSLISHDSYCCKRFASSRPYPTPREKNSFIGAPQTNPVQTLSVACPEQCRPHNLTGAAALANWTLC